MMDFARLTGSACLAAAFVFGCTETNPKTIPAKLTVTIHVPDMCERLELL